MFTFNAKVTRNGVKAGCGLWPDSPHFVADVSDVCLTVHFRIVFEEVRLHGYGNAEKQVGVDALALEDFVDVAPVAIELLGQPSGTSLLPTKLLFDELPYVHGGYK